MFIPDVLLRRAMDDDCTKEPFKHTKGCKERMKFAWCQSLLFIFVGTPKANFIFMNYMLKSL
jgi:hypothetical protein